MSKTVKPPTLPKPAANMRHAKTSEPLPQFSKSAGGVKGGLKPIKTDAVEIKPAKTYKSTRPRHW